MAEENSHYNNIFNKKNVEFEIDGENRVLPYNTEQEVTLKANQIVFSSINNIFQKLLDNDLYNEALLRKYIDYGMIGGPTYVSSINNIIDEPLLGKKFVVSGTDGISVLHKEEVPVVETLSGRYLDGIKVNKIDYINNRFVACTNEGIYESINKTRWTKRIGESGIDVVDICYNCNFLGNNVVSAFDFIAAANVSSFPNVVFYGHNGINNSWVSFNDDSALSIVSIKDRKANKIFSFENDSRLYVATGKGLYSSSLKTFSEEFKIENGTARWPVFDMVRIPNSDSFEQYLIGTSYGVKQSRKSYGFANLRNKNIVGNATVYDAIKYGDDFYVATMMGLVNVDSYGNSAFVNELENIPSYCIVNSPIGILVGTLNGVYLVSENDATLYHQTSSAVTHVAYFDNKIVFACDNSVYEGLENRFTRIEGIDGITAIKQFKLNGNTLYIVTDKNIYAMVSGSSNDVFIWTESFAEHNNVTFAQNITSEKIIVQVEDKLQIIDTAKNGFGSGSVVLSINIANRGNVKAAAEGEDADSYYVVIDNRLYRITKDTTELPEPIQNAKNIAFYKNAIYSQFNGLVFLDESNNLKLLKRNEGIYEIILISSKSFDDISIRDENIFAIKDNVLYKFAVSFELALRREHDFENGVSLQEYVGNLGYFQRGQTQHYDTYLSTTTNSLSIEINSLTAEISSGGTSNFIGYLDNVNNQKTILANDKIYNVSLNSGDIVTSEYKLTGTDITANPYNSYGSHTAFANVVARNRNNSLTTAIVFDGHEQALFAKTPSNTMLEKQHGNYTDATIILNNYIVVASEHGIFSLNISDNVNRKTKLDMAEINFNLRNSNISTPIFRLTQYSENVLLAIGSGNDILLSSDEKSEYLQWNRICNVEGMFNTYDADTSSYSNPMSASYGCIAKFPRKSISRASNSASISDILVGRQELRCINFDAAKISTLYNLRDGDNKVEFVYLDSNVYRISISGNNASAVSVDESPKTLDDIISGNIAKYNIENGLSIGLPKDVELVSKIIDSGSLTSIVSSDYKILNNIDNNDSITIIDESLSINQIKSLIRFYSLSSLVNLSSNSISSLDLELAFKLSGHFLDSALSEETDKEFTLSSSFSNVMSADWNSADWNPIVNVLNDFNRELRRYKSLSSTLIFKHELTLRNIRYVDGYSNENNSISVYFDLSASLYIPNDISMNIVPIYETNDGIRYDKVTRGRTQLNGYIADSEYGWIYYDGEKLYKFNSFNVDEIYNDYAFVNISKIKGNNNFNDLYYFRLDYQDVVIKTNITTHSADFNEIRNKKGDANDKGFITKLTIEQDNNCIYARKITTNSSDAYCLKENKFPDFNRLRFFVGYKDGSILSSNDSSLVSCKDKTMMLTTGQSGKIDIRIYENGNGNPDPTYSGQGHYYEDYRYFSTFNAIYAANGINHTYNDVDTRLYPIPGTAITSTNTEDQIDLQSNSDIDGQSIFTFCEDIQIGGSTGKALVDKNKLFIEGLTYNFNDVNTYVRISSSEYPLFAGVKRLITWSTYVIAIPNSDSLYTTALYSIDYSNNNYNVKNIGQHFTDIQGIYIPENTNTLYVIDNGDLKIYYNLPTTFRTYMLDGKKPDKLILGFFPYSNIENISKFRNFDPAIVANNSVYSINYAEKIAELNNFNLAIPNESYKFINRVQPTYIDRLFIQSLSDIYELNNNNTIISSILVATCDGEIEASAVLNDNNGNLNIWITTKTDSNHKAIKYDLSKDKDSEAYETLYDLNNSISCSSITYKNKPYLTTSQGLYELNSIESLTLDENNEIYKQASSLNNAKFQSLEFNTLNGDYVFSYGQTSSMPQKIRFYSNNKNIEEFLNSNVNLENRLDIMSYMFNRYFYIGSENIGCVYDSKKNIGSYISQDQLVTENNGYYSIMLFMKNHGGHLGLIGYGNNFYTFDSFSDIQAYGKPNSKYVALANNFNNKTTQIKVLNEQPDFLIGTSYGLKYVYDNLITRSFYSNGSTLNQGITKEITALEKVLVAGNDGYFIVGQGNSLFATFDLFTASFKHIYDFDPSEIILDLYSIQRNEYIIATNKGIYLTSMKYVLANDLTRFTVESIYRIINEELQKIIQNHIIEQHSSDSLVSKINKKMKNDLSFISSNDIHKDIFDASISNGVKVVKDDIIESIVCGGESTDDPNNYVKVGISNWAIRSLNPTYAFSENQFVTGFTDPSSGKQFDINTVPYIVKNWKSGLKEIYIYVPTTGTYYINNPRGISNSKFAYDSLSRTNVGGQNAINTLPDACTILRVYLYNSYFNINTIILAQCVGNSLPLKIYKDNENAEDNWKGVFDTVIQPSALRTLPMANGKNVNNVSNCTDEFGRIYLDFSIYGTDAQAIKIIAE